MTSRLPAPPPGSRVLELGCGSGKTAAWLAGIDLDLVGVDFSRTALTMNYPANRRCEGYTLAVADARHLPFRDEAFDVAFAVHIIGHLDKDDRIEAALELIRVLKRGGTLVFRGFSSRDFRFGRGDQNRTGDVPAWKRNYHALFHPGRDSRSLPVTHSRFG